MQKFDEILFSKPHPSEYPENYHVIDDVMRTTRLWRLNTGCEVGVRRGFFTKYLLERNKWLCMYAVDPYLPYQDVIDYQSEEMQKETKDKAVALLEPWADRVRWVFKPSVEAAQVFDNYTFDFVFIDAVHEYKDVKEDMAAWHRKVRPGGLLCGHDYSMDGIGRAVTEFAAAQGLQLKTVGAPSDVWLMLTR